MRFDLRIAGAGQAVARLKGLAQRGGPDGTDRLMRIAGNRMVDVEVQKTFETAGRHVGESWPKAQGWRRSGQTLDDQHFLRRSIGYRVERGALVVATQLEYGRIHQKGGVIKPLNKKFLAIPQVPPLSPSEARQHGDIRKRFPNAFVLMKGPDGPGLYRLARGAWHSTQFRSRKGTGPVAKYSKDTGPNIERIFAFARSVRIPRRTFLKWTDGILQTIRGLWQAHLLGGTP